MFKNIKLLLKLLYTAFITLLIKNDDGWIKLKNDYNFPKKANFRTEALSSFIEKKYDKVDEDIYPLS